jgi:hypothetical protein
MSERRVLPSQLKTMNDAADYWRNSIGGQYQREGNI